MKRGNERDEYLQRMEAAVANAHTAMKVLKEENIKLNEKVRSLESQIEGYEKEKKLREERETAILRPSAQLIAKIHPIKVSSGLAAANSRLPSFARPNFSSEKKVDMLSSIPLKKSVLEKVEPPSATNSKRMR
jgi:hypothetical protein